MSPYSCPDMISDVDAEETFISLEYKQDDIDKTVAYCIKSEYNTSFHLITFKGIYGYCYGKINYKQSIKFWSRVRSRCKKELKRLNDRGINGKGNLCRLTQEQYMTWANYHNQYLNAEDMMNQVRFYRKNNHIYNNYMIPVTTVLSK